MIVDISKIIVKKDRIRKDFGDIQELADDIKQNGLINPPVVNKEYELLAGERRLMACKSLGWLQIEVRMMDTRDAEHELNVEISENESRKEFSKTERVDYMKRLMRIETAKAKERQGKGNNQYTESLSQNSDGASGRADDATAKQFGISRDTMKKEISIVDHKDLLSPEDFADWDEGRLSTNKAFQKIKVELAERDRKIEALEIDKKERERYISTREDYIHELENRGTEVREVVKEVVPDDYEDLKRSKESSLKDYRSLETLRSKDQEKIKELQTRIKDLETRKDIDELQKKLEEEAGYFIIRTYEYIQKNGGYVWITEKIDDLPEKERENFKSAIFAIDAFAKQMVENIGGYAIG